MLWSGLPSFRTLIEFMSTRFEELQETFTQNVVKKLIPGFYDDASFIEMERQVPTLLDVYAEYCHLAAGAKNQTDIEQKLRRVVSFLSPLVAAHGLDGKCMPTTLLIQRFLAAEGVWNFPQRGGVVVNFPTSSHLPRHEFDPIDVRGGTNSHAWNVAPPFIIDLTISKQFYSSEQQPHVVGAVFAKEVSAAPTSPFEDPPSAAMQKVFPPFSVPLGPCSIDYYPYGTGGPTEAFTQIQQPVLDGLTPFALFQRFRSEQTDGSV